MRGMDRKRPTLVEVARRAGVSPSLASYALNGTGRVAPETAQKILQVSTELGYRANRHAQALRSGDETSYGFVIRNLKNPFFLDVLDALAPSFDGADRVLAIMDSRYRLDQQQRLLDALNAAGTTTALVAAVGGESPLIDWQRRSRSRMRLVTLNVAGSEDETDPVLPSVNLDHRAAVRRAVEVLSRHGHRRLTFLCAPEGQESDQVRRVEFQQACADAGVEPEVVRTPLSYQEVLAACEALMASDRHDLALIFNSDYLASAAYEAARQVGRVIGGDVSVIGHDDLATSRLLTPGLATFRFSREELGTAVIRALDATTPVHLVVPVEFVPRGSVADR